MYPQPLILKFLPDVLRLSLAGIEPSDVRKTALVLHLYSTILAWLPTVCPEYCDIASTYDDDDAPTLRSYIELIEDKKGHSNSREKEEKKEMIIRVELSPSEINDQYEELSRYMCQEWCDALLKKFFALLEAQEAEVEGAAQSPLTGLCLYDEMRCDAIRELHCSHCTV
jgi:DNA-binding ferritin-like protein (Dps family)